MKAPRTKGHTARGTGALALAAALFAVVGCRNEPYCVENCGEDVEPIEVVENPDVVEVPVDVQPGVDADPGDVDPTGCIPGVTNLEEDPNHCGMCGRACRLPNAIPSCRGGMCVVPANGCDVGYYDLNGRPDDGCEYACTPVPGVTNDVTCDGRDDNCDGRTDEGVELCNDANNCGACGRACTLPNAMARCARADGTPMDAVCTMSNTRCLVARCNAGFVDADGNPNNGCEYACVSSGPEVCDGRDNDCNGRVDDGLPPPASCGLMRGACRAGMLQCVDGSLRCMGSTGPRSETCNSIDDDCDGTVDNGFDLQSDPANCGRCGTVCPAQPNAVVGCRAGRCERLACNPGFMDRDGNAANGCEAGCNYLGPDEVCNGLDDNCNGQIDEGITPPANFCRSVGECAGATARCMGTMGFRCSYNANVDLDPATGQPAAVETRCDGRDNNCNGAADESFTQLDTACTSTGATSMGVCLTTGRYVCNAAGTGVRCNAPTPPAPSQEICDGLDNDCDGRTDETRASPGSNPSYVQTSWVQTTSGLWIMQYEASRPDASSSEQGTLSSRACSRPNVLPWTNLTAVQAAAACTAAGGRLCSETEWQRACRGSANTCAFAYTSSSACGTYDTDTCNAIDYDVDPAIPGTQNGLVATGSLSSCGATWSSARVFDLSGNVREFTAPRSAGVNPLRGGAYTNVGFGTRCDFNFSVADDTFQFVNVGFRCCYSGTTPP